MTSYEAPRVDELGDVERLTQGAGFSGVDMGSQNSNNPNVDDDGTPPHANGP